MKTKTEQTHPRLTGTLVYAALAIWLFLSIGLALRGSYQPGPAKPPLIFGLTLLVPMLAFGLLFWSNQALQDFAHALDLKWIVALNFTRIEGFDFLVQYTQGNLPAAFALPAGWGDVIIGVAAIPLALMMAKNAPKARGWFVAWNLLGLLDLFTAIGSGVLHSQSSAGILAGAGPTTLLMTQFPRSLVPTFLVPVFILLHLLALARRNEVKGQGTAMDRETLHDHSRIGARIGPA